MKQRFIDFLIGKEIPSYGYDIDRAVALLPDGQKQDFVQGLNRGDVNIAKMQDELGIVKPQTKEEIALANSGQFNKPEMVKQGGLIQGYKQGYNLNYDNPTNTVGTRIGQALGSVGRFVDSPLGRGLIAYGLSNAMGDDNPLEQALTAGVGRYNAQTADKVYRNQLRNLGMNEQELGNIRGNITDDIFKNYTLANYRNNMTNYRNLKLDKDTYIKQQQNIYKMLNDGVITAEEATKQMQLLNDEYQKQNPMDMQESNKTVQGNRRLDIMEEKNDITRELGGERNDILQQNANTYATKVANDGKDNRPETNRVRVQAPNGQTGTIPRAKLREAIAKGYKVI